MVFIRKLEIISKLDLKILSLFLVLSFSFSTQAQVPDSIQLKPISTAATNTHSKQRLIHRFSINMKIIAFKGDPRLTELAEYTDTVLVKTDTACVVLKNGGRWNPLTAPSTKGIIFKTIFSKKQDSVYNNTMKYLQFSSNDYPYYLIDSLYFTNSYYNLEGELLIKIEFINKPFTRKDWTTITNRRVIYFREE